jgi:hypothetical protein
MGLRQSGPLHDAINGLSPETIGDGFRLGICSSQRGDCLSSNSMGAFVLMSALDLR